jgi:hypothetical protein
MRSGVLPMLNDALLLSRLTDDLPRSLGVKNPSNCRVLRGRLCDLIREAKYFTSYKQFLDELADFQARATQPAHPWSRSVHHGDIALNDNGLTKFLSGDDTKINAPDFRLIVYFLHESDVLRVDNQGPLIAKHFRHPLYHTLLDFMSVSHSAQSCAKLLLPGLYQAWRPSTTFPGHFWKGKLRIAIDNASGALTTLEHYAAVQADGRRNRSFDFDGYMIVVDRHYTHVSRNLDRTSLQFVQLSQIAISQGRVTSMGGLVLDGSSGWLYASRVLYDLIASETELTEDLERHVDDDLGIVPADNVPGSIRARFERKRIPGVTMF